MALGSGDLIDHCSLIVIHVLCIVRIIVIKVFCQLQHIVSCAGLAVFTTSCISKDIISLLIRIFEHLACSNAAD